MTGIFGILYCLFYIKTKGSNINTDTVKTVEYLLSYLEPLVNALIAMILALSVIYLAKSIKRSTGKKQKICLLTWHILNLLILVGTLLFTAIEVYEIFKADTATDNFLRQ